MRAQHARAQAAGVDVDDLGAGEDGLPNAAMQRAMMLKHRIGKARRPS